MTYMEYFTNLQKKSNLNVGVGGGDPLEVSLRQAKLVTDLYPYQSIPTKVLDYGCGIGRTIPTLSILWPAAKFIGVDISKDFLNFCVSQTVFQGVEFYYNDLNVEHYDNYNTEELSSKINSFDRANNSISADFAYAFSVLTHLNILEARDFFADISSSLKVNGLALISCFILDSQSIKSINDNTCNPFKFKVTVDSNADWFEGDPASPGAFTAFSFKLLDSICADFGLTIIQLERGSWRSLPNRTYHDMLVLKKFV